MSDRSLRSRANDGAAWLLATALAGASFAPATESLAAGTEPDKISGIAPSTPASFSAAPGFSDAGGLQSWVEIIERTDTLKVTLPYSFHPSSRSDASAEQSKGVLQRPFEILRAVFSGVVAALENKNSDSSEEISLVSDQLDGQGFDELEPYEPIETEPFDEEPQPELSAADSLARNKHYLGATYPNPSHVGTITIRFAPAEENAPVSLQVIDVNGRKLDDLLFARVLDQNGEMLTHWQAPAPGVYFLHYRCGEVRESKKIVVIK